MLFGGKFFQYIVVDKCCWRCFVVSGYVWVDVDVCGLGVLFGVCVCEWFFDEIWDGVEIVDWIVCQFWCNGMVVVLGNLYDGMLVELLLVNQYFVVWVIVLCFLLFDVYIDIVFFGGIYVVWFIDIWGCYNEVFDCNVLYEVVGWWVKFLVIGMQLVQEDCDCLLWDGVIVVYCGNYDVYQIVGLLMFWDDVFVLDFYCG